MVQIKGGHNNVAGQDSTSCRAQTSGRVTGWFVALSLDETDASDSHTMSGVVIGYQYGC
jgi:hypothetical protein